MTLNILFLPLLGGFLFYGLFNGTSHRAPVQSPQVLLFWSAAIGLGLLLTGRVSIYLFQEVFREPHSVQLSIFAAATAPLMGALVMGFAILFATHAIHSSVIEAHKLKAVLGIVAAALAGYFFLQLDPMLATPWSRVLGLDFRVYAVAVVVGVTWAAQRFAKFGKIPLRLHQRCCRNPLRARQRAVSTRATVLCRVHPQQVGRRVHELLPRGIPAPGR